MHLLPFAVAGVVTIVAFSIRAFQEGMSAYAFYGGPAVLFALVLSAVARRSLSLSQMAGIVVASLFAYGVAVVCFLWLPNRFDSQELVFLAPVVGAGLLLWILGEIAEGRSRDREALGLGMLLSLVSGFPLVWLEFMHESSQHWLGVHILTWYCGVGPFAVQILCGSERPAPTGPEEKGGTEGMAETPPVREQP